MSQFVTLEPMTPERYARWLPMQIEDYARDKVEAGAWAESEARKLSAAEMTTTLPDGPETPEHHLFIGVADGNEIGNLWLWAHTTAAGQEAYIFNIEVDADQQGKGFGRGLLEASERWCVQHGITAVRLNVFSHNPTAVRLYETSGFEPTNMNMVKRLPNS